MTGIGLVTVDLPVSALTPWQQVIINASFSVHHLFRQKSSMPPHPDGLHRAWSHAVFRAFCSVFVSRQILGPFLGRRRRRFCIDVFNAQGRRACDNPLMRVTCRNDAVHESHCGRLHGTVSILLRQTQPENCHIRPQKPRKCGVVSLSPCRMLTIPA